MSTFVKPDCLTKHTTIIFSIAQASCLRGQRNRKVGTLHHTVDKHLHTNPSIELVQAFFTFAELLSINQCGFAKKIFFVNWRAMFVCSFPFKDVKEKSFHHTFRLYQF